MWELRDAASFRFFFAFCGFGGVEDALPADSDFRGLPRPCFVAVEFGSMVPVFLLVFAELVLVSLDFAMIVMWCCYSVDRKNFKHKESNFRLSQPLGEIA